MVDKNIKIAIIGGGIAGFASGLSLIKNGFLNVKVFERDETIDQRRQGYGLTILQGINALKKLDVYSEVYDMDTPSRSHFIFDLNGNLIGFFGTIFWSTNTEVKKNKKHNLHLSRQDLRNIILNKYISLHPNKKESIEWNKKLINILENDSSSNNLNNYILEFSDLSIYTADLIIGCDGINSITRKFKYPLNDLPLNYLGILLVLGISQTNHHLGNQRIFQTVDGHIRLFAMPFSKTDQSKNIMWQLSFPLDEKTAKFFSQETLQLKNYLIDKCKDWHEPIPEMIKSTELNLLMGIPAFDRDLIEPINDSKKIKIALLGDAAHPMSPFKGQGANQALIDSCELTEFLNKSCDINTAIYDFEIQMKKRVISKVLASRERVTSYHQADILNTENFINRGVNENFLETLKKKGVNAQTADIELVIINEMKKLELSS